MYVPPVEPPVVPPVEPPLELPPWQTEQGVLVAFTFLCAETPLGAVPTTHEPQLAEVERTETVPVVVGGVVVPPLELPPWQTAQGVLVEFTLA